MKTLKAKCVFCGKEVFSLYKGQLEYNVKAHELSCPMKATKKPKGDQEASETPSSSSLS